MKLSKREDIMILLSASEAAKLLGVSLRTFHYRNVPATATNTKGNALGWSEADLIKWKEENKK